MDVPIRTAAGQVAMERVLPYRDGRCAFLDEEDRCRIYQQRPADCRRFECAPAYHHGGADLCGHGEFLRRNPNVLAMLEDL
jgi:Fe-S-cluster containining protein